MKLGRATAVIDGRDYVTPDDVKAIAVPALAHRIVLRPELWVRGVEASQVVNEILASVPTPATLPSDRSGDDTPHPQADVAAPAADQPSAVE